MNLVRVISCFNHAAGIGIGALIQVLSRFDKVVESVRRSDAGLLVLQLDRVPPSFSSVVARATALQLSWGYLWSVRGV